MNTIGGYKCDCEKGYVPSEDGRKCIGRFISVALQLFHLVHCVKSVRIPSLSGPYFSTFGLIRSISPYSVRMRENIDQKNSEY